MDQQFNLPGARGFMAGDHGTQHNVFWRRRGRWSGRCAWACPRRWPTASGSGPTASSRGAIASSRGATASSREAIASSSGPTASSRGATASSSGPTASSRGATASSSGPTASSRGATASSSGAELDVTRSPLDSTWRAGLERLGMSRARWRHRSSCRSPSLRRGAGPPGTAWRSGGVGRGAGHPHALSTRRALRDRRKRS